jgi:LmbE family N-acetylglucosaminyl deacetylase
MKSMIWGLSLALTVLAVPMILKAGVPKGSLLDGVKPGPDGKIDLVTIFPHEDDELNAAGSFLKLKKENPNVRTHIVCFTLGELSSAKETLNLTPEFQGKIRTKELEAAATVIGVDSLIQLQYHDQGLPTVPLEELRNKVLEVIEKTHAEVVITYGPDGLTGHLDHLTLSKAVADAFPKSGAQKLYYAAMPKEYCPLVKAINKTGCTAATMCVNIKAEKKLKKLAWYEHTTQKFFSGPLPSPDLTFLRNEECFNLAASKP